MALSYVFVVSSPVTFNIERLTKGEANHVQTLSDVVDNNMSDELALSILFYVFGPFLGGVVLLKGIYSLLVGRFTWTGWRSSYRTSGLNIANSTATILAFWAFLTGLVTVVLSYLAYVNYLNVGFPMFSSAVSFLSLHFFSYLAWLRYRPASLNRLSSAHRANDTLKWHHAFIVGLMCLGLAVYVFVQLYRLEMGQIQEVLLWWPIVLMYYAVGFWGAVACPGLLTIVFFALSICAAWSESDDTNSRV